ncbi:MAG: neutral zinc metallopeptidase [Rhizobiales bacterium]|nr:neutral zinc metallopeptidase [Hyphomicrobiales bacterium]
MKWEDFRSSENVEDYRGGGGGGGLGGAVGGGGLGIGAVLILSVIGYFIGIDPRILISGASIVTGGSSSQSAAPPKSGPPKDDVGRFVSAILAQNEDVWSQTLPAQKNIRYVAPKLVLFSGATRSACGAAQSAMGPFYCPLDQKVYLDTSFFDDMKRKLGGGGDFAYAYVIAHEIGHHIENLMGILPKVQEAQQRSSQQQANALSVRVELMADCLAGVWAANADQKWKILEEGDVQEAMQTASAIGDDRLQKSSRGYAVPDSFTHGSSAQRVQWFTTGLKSGQVDACNTFRR